MHAELFGSLRAYPLFLLLGDLVGIAVAWHCALRVGLSRARFAASLIVLTAAAVIGAKLYGLIERAALSVLLPQSSRADTDIRGA